MSSRAKGPRLHLRPERRKKDGTLKSAAGYVILDTIKNRRHEESTGCGPDARGDAEQELAAYLARKHAAKVVSGPSKEPEDIPIADVLTLYLLKKVDGQARPDEVKQRITKLLGYWGELMLSDVSGDTCDGYAEHRISEGSTAYQARRELEDLRSAINFHRKRGLCRAIISVTLPDKWGKRERWLTRAEAALLLWKAWRYREKQNFRATDRFTRRHIAKFMIVAAYTGTRSGAICNASFEKMPGRGWIDLENGVFYRRPAGEVETKKRKPPVKLPPRLLMFLRIWHKTGQRFVIEWNGEPVKRMHKAFGAVVRDAGLGDEVIPHIYRHTAATWAMQNGGDPWEVAGYLGMTVETLIRNYGHHHPEQYKSVHQALEHRRERAA